MYMYVCNFICLLLFVYRPSKITIDFACQTCSAFTLPVIARWLLPQLATQMLSPQAMIKITSYIKGAQTSGGMRLDTVTMAVFFKNITATKTK